MNSIILFSFCSLAKSWAVFKYLSKDAVRGALSLEPRFSVVKYHLSASFGHTGLSTDLTTSSGFPMFKLIHITQTTMANYRPPGRGEKALVEWFSLLFNF